MNSQIKVLVLLWALLGCYACNVSRELATIIDDFDTGGDSDTYPDSDLVDAGRDGSAPDEFSCPFASQIAFGDDSTYLEIDNELEGPNRIEVHYDIGTSGPEDVWEIQLENKGILVDVQGHDVELEPETCSLVVHTVRNCEPMQPSACPTPDILCLGAKGGFGNVHSQSSNSYHFSGGGTSRITMWIIIHTQAGCSGRYKFRINLYDYGS